MRARVAILALVCGVTFFLGLGRSSITDSDEAFYAESAREMVESQNWLTPHFNYDVRFEKPVLYYWAVATTYAVAGVSSAAARWPSALSGLALVLLTYASGRRWLSEPVGFLAGLIVATSFGYFAIARMALPDLPLTFFVCATIAAGALALGPGADAAPDAHRRRWLVVAASAAGLAVLTKGPVGLVLPALVLGAWCIWVREGWSFRAVWRPSAADTGLAVLAFLAVAVPWYAAMYLEHGGAYLYRFFVGENLARFATARYNEPRSPLFYLPIVLAGLFPWSLFLPGWLKDAWRGVRPPHSAHRLLWVWWLLPLIFYSVSVGKQPRYVLPILPPLALFIAHAIHVRTTELEGRSRLWMSLPTAAIGAALTLLGLALHRLALLLLNVTDIGGFSGLTTLGAGLLIALGVMLMVVTWTVPVRLVPTLVVIAAALTQLTLAFTVLASSWLEPVQQMSTLVRASRLANEPLATHRVFVRNLVFYTGVKTLDLFDPAQAREFLRSPERVLCVMLEPAVRELEAEGFDLQRLGEVRYFNPAGVRAGTLIAPDEARDIQTVVLVSNRR